MTSNVIDNAKRRLDEAFDHWHRTGIYIDRAKLTPDGKYDYRSESMGVPQYITRRLIRQAAKELKRPVLMAREGFQSLHQHVPGTSYRQMIYTITSMSLDVPRRKYLMPIVNPLALAAEHVAGRYYSWKSGSSPAPIVMYTRPTIFQFVFYDLDIWAQYYEQICTREEMRAALKITTGGNDERITQDPAAIAA